MLDSVLDGNPAEEELKVHEQLIAWLQERG